MANKKYGDILNDLYDIVVDGKTEKEKEDDRKVYIIKVVDVNGKFYKSRSYEMPTINDLTIEFTNVVGSDLVYFTKNIISMSVTDEKDMANSHTESDS